MGGLARTTLTTPASAGLRQENVSLVLKLPLGRHDIPQMTTPQCRITYPRTGDFFYVENLMSLIYSEKKLRRSARYWDTVLACFHGDWCLDCHWLCSADLDEQTLRPFNYEDYGRIFIHEDIYLGLFPDGLDKESLLISNCGANRCVNPTHQKRILTCEQNSSGSGISPKRTKRGGYSKMTPEVVLEIRRLREEGMEIKTIAERFRTSTGNVGMIVRRHTWKNI